MDAISVVCFRLNGYNKSMTKKGGVLDIFFLILTAVVLGFVLYGNHKETPKEKSPSQKPTECIPLTSFGKQVYNIPGKPKNFKIVEVDLDPIDVKMSETQTIIVKVKERDADTISRQSEVTANIITDNANTVVKFRLILAEDEVALDGSKYFVTLWQGLWIREDDNCHTYGATITAKNYKGKETSVDLRLK